MLELDKLPIYELQIMYYQFWKEREEESKMTPEQQGAAALGRVIEESI